MLRLTSLGRTGPLLSLDVSFNLAVSAPPPLNAEFTFIAHAMQKLFLV